MMTTRILIALLLAAGVLSCAGAAQARQETVFVCFAPDGSVAMGSAPSGENCEQLSGEVPNAAPAKPAAAPAAAAAEGAAAAAATPVRHEAAAAPQDLPPLETRLAAYRKTMLDGASGVQGVAASATNPAVSRRYRMTSRAAYLSSR